MTHQTRLADRLALQWQDQSLQVLLLLLCSYSPEGGFPAGKRTTIGPQVDLDVVKIWQKSIKEQHQ